MKTRRNKAKNNKALKNAIMTGVAFINLFNNVAPVAALCGNGSLDVFSERTTAQGGYKKGE